MNTSWHVFFIFIPDYRRIPRALSNVYYHPLNEDNRREINKIFDSFASADPSDPPIRNRALNIWGRSLLVPESTSKLAKFRFDDLCGQPLSAADYLEVTKAFGTVFILDVPKMGIDSKDKAIRLRGFLLPSANIHFWQARRFITFIDGIVISFVAA